MEIINICSPTWELAESYGRIAIELAKGLQSADTHVNRVGEDVGERPLFKPALGGILLGYPTLWEEFLPIVSNGPRIAITMFESTKLPDGWTEPLNEMDAVVVPAHWLVDVFRQNGVTVPIHVVPLGISNTFKAVAARDWSQKPFTFISIADRGWRKGWWHNVQAFTKAFGKSTDVHLILKTRDKVLKAAFIDTPNIRVVDDSLTDEQMVDLYHQAHVMVAANCGEGFGFTPREFAATGGLALATNWGGTADDLHWWGQPIAYSLDKAWRDIDDWHGKLGDWAEPDVDALASLMRYIVAHPSAYEDFAIRAAGYVVTHYRWSLFAKQVQHIWRGVLEKRYGSVSSGENALPAQVAG